MWSVNSSASTQCTRYISFTASYFHTTFCVTSVQPFLEKISWMWSLKKEVRCWHFSFFFFSCSVRVANCSFFLFAKPQLIHLHETALSSVNLECALLTSAAFGLYISISEKFARRAARWTDTFIYYWRLCLWQPRTGFLEHAYISLSVLVTPQCVCVCVLVCFPHPRWCHR